MKTGHVHPATCNLAHWLTRHTSPTIYRCFALPQLLYRWRDQSRKFWIPPCTYILIYIRTYAPYLPTYLLTHSLTQWSRVLLENLAGSHLVKKFPHFMEPEVSLPRLQKPATCPYPEPDQFSPWLPRPTSWRSVLILSLHLCVGLPSDLFLSVFPTKTSYAPLLSP